MPRLQGLLLVFLCGWVWGGASGQCPPNILSPCVCSPSIYEPVAILCDNAGSLANVLAAIAPARNVQIDSLLVTNTPIARLGPNSFQGFTIIRLVMNKNQMNDIDNFAFDGPLLDSLLELDLKDNNLAQVPQRGVPKLKNLRKLYLNKNKISGLSSNAFNSYESKDMLLKLELSSNNLRDFGSSNVFSVLRNLEELSLEANSLTQIPTAALRQQREKLTDLNLGLNSINNVANGALDFPNLKSLSLEFNGMTRLSGEALSGVPNLLYLYITGNKFPTWDPETFRYVTGLQILGIGETPIRVIPSNAFRHIRSLVRLEMSEAAVDDIQQGAFQQTSQIQAIILNKNRLTRVRRDMFQRLGELYTLDLQGNQLNAVDDLAFANLPSLSHLDISKNQLEVLSQGTFQNTFLPSSDVRLLYICENPWVCDERLEWFRRWLRNNMDIMIDKRPACLATCNAPDWFPEGWPIRDPDPPRPTSGPPQPFRGSAMSIIGWIILAIILAILLTSICLLGVVRYFVSRRRKKQKDEEEEEQRIISSAASGYHPASVGGSGYPALQGPVRPYPAIQYGPPPPTSGVDIDLPPATNLDDRPAYWAY